MCKLGFKVCSEYGTCCIVTRCISGSLTNIWFLSAQTFLYRYVLSTWCIVTGSISGSVAQFTVTNEVLRIINVSQQKGSILTSN